MTCWPLIRWCCPTFILSLLVRCPRVSWKAPKNKMFIIIITTSWIFHVDKGTRYFMNRAPADHISNLKESHVNTFMRSFVCHVCMLWSRLHLSGSSPWSEALCTASCDQSQLRPFAVLFVHRSSEMFAQTQTVSLSSDAGPSLAPSCQALSDLECWKHF